MTNHDFTHVETATDSLIDDALAGINRALAHLASEEDSVLRNLEAARSQLQAAGHLRRMVKP